MSSDARGERFLGVIPIRGADDEFAEGAGVKLGDRPLIAYTIEAARAARHLDRLLVFTDSPGIAALARELGAEAPFLRPPSLADRAVTVTEVLQHVVTELESRGYVPDWVVKLEITHPFRPPGIIDHVIEAALAQRVDSAFLAYEEPHSYWITGDDGRPLQVGDDMDVPRALRRRIYRDVGGVVSVTRAENLRRGVMYGRNVALVTIDDLFVTVDLHEGHAPHYRDRVGFRLAEAMADAYRQAIKDATPGPSG
jgi:N-acylneuraminate cytidylyltransferase